MRTVVTTPTIVRHGTSLLRVAISPRRAKAATHRTVRAEVLPREGGVDDRHGLPHIEIVDGKRAAFEQLLPGHREKASCHLFEIGRCPIAPVTIFPPFDFDRAVPREHHPEPIRERDRLELRIVSDLLQQPVVEDLARRRCRVIAVHQPHARRDECGRVVAVVNRLLCRYRAKLQQRPDEQYAGHDDLKDDQAAREKADRMARVSASTVSENVDGVRSRRYQRRQQARQHRGGDRRHDGEQQYGRIDVEGNPRRRPILEVPNRRRQPVDRRVGERDPDNRADAGDEQTLRQHLPDQPHPRCAERRSDRQLLRAQRRARELHVHDVDARDQEHADAEPEHRPQRAAQRAWRECVEQTLDLSGIELLVGVRVRGSETFRDRRRFGVGLVERDVCSSGDRGPRGCCAAASLRGRGGNSLNNGIQMLFVRREREAPGHDADDGRRLAVDA